MYAAGDIDNDGDVDLADVGLITSGFGVSTCASPSPLTSTQFARADVNADCALNITDLNIVLSNFGQTSALSMHRKLRWDAENRLIAVEPASPSTGDKKVLYTYDYLGRRVQRIVYTYGASAWNATADENQRTVYYNWLPLIEFDGLNSNAVLRRWTWGLDLAGLNGSQNSIDQAGGIGGLLATYDTSGSKAYIYFHDGNGNVGQVIEPTASTASASLVARYEYDAYGNVTSSGGSYAATNRMRFSTKPWDAVTDLGYWGYRWYSAKLGRWVSRDPIGELGDYDVYAIVRNSIANRIDSLGQQSMPATQSSGGCCGPDVTHALEQALELVEHIDNASLGRRCRGMFNKDTGWDIMELMGTGSNDFPELAIEGTGCGTGGCRGTVKHSGNCYRAGELNYLLWGVLGRKCDEYVNGLFYNMSGKNKVDVNGESWCNVGGAWFPCNTWDRDHIGIPIVGYRLLVNLGFVKPPSSAPIGPGSTLCRLLMAGSGYDGVYHQLPESCKVSKCGIGCCDKEYERAFQVRIAGEYLP